MSEKKRKKKNMLDPDTPQLPPLEDVTIDVDESSIYHEEQLGAPLKLSLKDKMINFILGVVIMIVMLCGIAILVTLIYLLDRSLARK